ncbi:hypothetical protein [Aquisphaera insulae]|uniref:hypothetical protein n=1 Tax=Aquisphaera insulae TaxID=2712864 RepID=UPI0013EB2A0B|nr:hypothetical protein [Aquisphaera insulae]
MATAAQIQANRSNAKKSSGPKTEAGKAAARMNALKHGNRSRRLAMPVLPQEDPKELDRRVREYVQAGKASNAIERDLLTRAARLSFMLERSDRAEAAYLARLARAALKAGANEPSEERERRVEHLARDLFLEAAPGCHRNSDIFRDVPAAFLAGLEEMHEGRAWLIRQWLTQINLLCGRDQFGWGDFYRYVRLLGKLQTEANVDLELNAVIAAFDAFLGGGKGQAFYEYYCRRTRIYDKFYEGHRSWRVLGEPPASSDAAQDFLIDLAERKLARLEAMEAAATDDDVDVDADELADAAAFDAGPELDRHRRTSSARGRELLRILDAVVRLKKCPGMSHDEAVEDSRTPIESTTTIEPNPGQSEVRVAVVETQATPRDRPGTETACAGGEGPPAVGSLRSSTATHLPAPVAEGEGEGSPAVRSLRSSTATRLPARGTGEEPVGSEGPPAVGSLRSSTATHLPARSTGEEPVGSEGVPAVGVLRSSTATPMPVPVVEGEREGSPAVGSSAAPVQPTAGLSLASGSSPGLSPLDPRSLPLEPAGDEPGASVIIPGTP